MAKTAFFDIKGWDPVKGPSGVSLYIFEDGRLAGTIPSGDEGPFAFERGFPEDIGESFLSLPPGLMNFRVLELPFSEKENIMDVLPLELDGIVLGGSGSIVFDARVLGKADGKFRVLAAYAEKKALREILEKLKALGADPRAVTSIELSAASVSALESGEGFADAILNPRPMAVEERTGLALKEAGSPFINIRTGELSYTLDSERARRSLRLTYALAVLVALVFVSDVAFSIFMSKREISSIKSEIRKTYLSAFPGEQRVSNELYQLKARLKELKDKEASYSGASPLGLLLDLTKVMRPGVAFSEVGIGPENVVLKGECPSLSDAEALKGDLEKYLSDVRVSDTKPSGQNKISFTITAKGTAKGPAKGRTE